MTSIMDIDGERAMVIFNPETRTFRGEFVNLNGGADFYADSLPSLLTEGRNSLAAFLEVCSENGIDPKRPTDAPVR
ncbi:type II toxin-antitoxin system HicB family antitoxin [Aureimonas sp. N4]|uniref:type II toxin-antitoxin system HicB family antitoxin n=1 Tax=Aureimonas sp. N4 TaxID=1638165 RepID=UPI000780D561|nr:type II toxin-antitoxin system HicB family antitoxin [Aureimonas sp. N4]